MADNIQTVISQSESVLMAGFESSFRASHFMILLVVFGARTLPNMGKHVTPSGQISLPVCAQKCITNRSFGGVCFYDSLLLSLILSLRGGVVSMVCGWDTKQKMKHGLHRRTRIGLFTDSFFDDIELMILGFWF